VLGDLESREDNLTAARSCYREALGLYQAIPDRLGQAHTLLSLGDLESMEANLAAARSCYREALGLYQAIPDRLGQANTLQSLGELESMEANYAAARSCYREALGLFQAIPDRLGQANTLRSLGDLERREANLTAARSCYREALGLYQAIPDRLGQANTLKSLGDLELREANLTAARSCYREALGLYQAIPDRLGQANTLRSLGDLESMEANYAAARSNYLQALELARGIPDLVCQLNSLVGLARLEAALNNRDAACQRYAELFALTDSTPAFANHPITQNLRREAAQVCSGEAGRSSAAEGIYGVQQREPNQAEMAQLQQLANLIIAWIQTPDWSTSRTYLEEHQDELLTDAAEQALQLLIQANPGRDELTQHLEILQACRAQGIAAAYAPRESNQAEMAQLQQLANLIIAWIQTPDWSTSRTYLEEHQDELLTDAAEQALQLLIQANPNVRQLPQHLEILQRARRDGISAAYAQREQAEMAQLLQQLFESFMNISNSAEMEQFVAQTPAQQLDVLEGFLDYFIPQLPSSEQAAWRQRLEDLRQLRRNS
jgi:tetratricopeptide (TPR) repeat protein